MKQYTEKELKATLKKIGIRKGSAVLIHSALHVLGKIKNSTNDNPSISQLFSPKGGKTYKIQYLRTLGENFSSLNHFEPQKFI